mmetsp:Transcript_17461/g.35647  ORF Transcript_17461/g.35647 Transcript_17461/m.35647 type:complete len:276 (-) Transcript_17461:128-955(-)
MMPFNGFTFVRMLLVSQKGAKPRALFSFCWHSLDDVWGVRNCIAELPLVRGRRRRRHHGGAHRNVRCWLPWLRVRRWWLRVRLGLLLVLLRRLRVEPRGIHGLLLRRRWRGNRRHGRGRWDRGRKGIAAGTAPHRPSAVDDQKNGVDGSKDSEDDPLLEDSESTFNRSKEGAKAKERRRRVESREWAVGQRVKEERRGVTKTRGKGEGETRKVRGGRRRFVRAASSGRALALTVVKPPFFHSPQFWMRFEMPTPSPTSVRTRSKKSLPFVFRGLE